MKLTREGLIYMLSQKDNLDEIKKLILKLSQQVEKQGEKIRQLETELNRKREKEAVLQEERVTQIISESKKEPDLSRIPTPPPPSKSIQELPKFQKEPSKLDKKEIAPQAISLEERIGGQWFTKIGIVVLVLGVSFFLKYAFDNNWIGETGRVLIGIFVGLALLAWGEKTIRQYFLYGQIVSGGGLVILYLSIYAALNFYHLIAHSAAFAFMALITASGVALSLRYNAPSLIMTAILGGFFTPGLVSDGANYQVSLFSYIVLLDIAILVVSVFKKWRWLNIAGLAGTFFIFSSWYDAFYEAKFLGITFFFLSVFFLIYSASSLVYNIYKNELSGGIEQVLSILNALFYFITVYNLFEPSYHNLLGLFSLGLAVYYLFSAHLVRVLTPLDKRLYDFLAILSVTFITLAIVLQFDKYVITILWALEAIFLFFLAAKHKSHSISLRILGYVVLTFATFRSLAIDSSYYRLGDWLFVNKVFVSSLFVVGAFYVGSYALKEIFTYEFKLHKFKVLKLAKAATVLLIVAHCLTVFYVDRDISVFHKHKISEEYQAVQKYNSTIINRYGDYSGYRHSVDHEKINALRERKIASILIFWLLYGLACLSWGLARQNRYLTLFGIILNGLAVVELLAVDLWEFKSLSRNIVSFFAISTMYAAATAYYQLKAKDWLGYARFVFVSLLIAANITTVLVISRDIYVYYDNQKLALRQEINKICQPSAYYSDKRLYSSVPMEPIQENSKCIALKERAKTLENKASIIISLFWMLYAIILIIIGFIRHYKYVRVGGIILLGIAIFKLFIMDLWSLGQLYRIIALISLGSVLLGVSYFYQKRLKGVFNSKNKY